MRIRSLVFAAVVLLASTQLAAAQKSTATDAGEAVNGLQLAILQHGTTKTDVPNLQVTFRNVGDRDLTVLLGIVGGYSPRPCNLDDRQVSCTLNFNLNVTDSSGKARSYEFSGIVSVAGRLDPYIVNVPAQSTYTLELGLDQFSAPRTPGSYRIALEFEGRAITYSNPNQPEAKLTFWKGTLLSNSVSIAVTK